MISRITIDELSNAGYATAVATLQTAMWTGLQGTADAYFDCFTPELQEEFQNTRAKEADRARFGTTSCQPHYPDDYFDCFPPEIRQQFKNKLAGEAEYARSIATSPAGSCGSRSEELRSVRIYVQHFVSGNELELEYELDLAGRVSRRCRQPFRRVGEAWKINGPPQEVR